MKIINKILVSLLCGSFIILPFCASAGVTNAVNFSAASTQYAYADGGGNAVTAISGNFTFEFWFKPTSAALGELIGNPGTDNSGDSFSIQEYNWTGTYKYRFYMRTTSATWKYIPSDNDVSAGTWIHVAGTWDGTTQKFWIDGSVQSTTNSSFTPLYNTLDYFAVGAGRYSDSTFKYPVNGAMDEMRISDSVRYSSNFTPETTEFSVDGNTVALYHFNDDLQDAGTNSVHLTGVNSPTYVTGKVESVRRRILIISKKEKCPKES